MKKNLKIFSTLLIITIITGIGNVFATNTSPLITTLSGTTIKTTTIGIGSGTYPALYTASSTYDSLFAFSTSNGTSEFYAATVGTTFTITALGKDGNDIVSVKQKNKTYHILNNYSGTVIY